MSEKCFKKCIYKPGTKLDNSEQVRELNVEHYVTEIMILRDPTALTLRCIIYSHKLSSFRT